MTSNRAALFRSLPHLSALALLVSCGGPSATTGPATPTTSAALPGALLDQTGDLALSDTRAGLSLADRFDVPVQAGDRLFIEVTSSAFDPTLEVTPPGGGRLVNDDWNGDRQRSRLEFVVATAGSMKVQVSSFAPTSTGAYRVVVLRAGPSGVAQPGQAAAALTPLQGAFLAPGQSTEGALAAGDGTASDGSFYDTVVVSSPHESAVTVRVSSPSNDPLRVLVTNARGQSVAQQSNGVFVLPGAQMHRVQVIAPAAGRGARWAIAVTETAPGVENAAVGAVTVASHRTPPTPTTVPVVLGQRVTGALAQGDQTLLTSELTDVYALDLSPGASVSVELASDAFDAYLVAIGPTGQRVENDDSGGTRNASLEIEAPQRGRYLLFASSYRPGETGAYELKVLPAQRASTMTTPGTGPTPTPTTGAAQTVNGALAQGDTTLRTGEFSDTYTYDLVAGSTVRLRLSSSAFDPYLIVQPPSGAQADNDDLSPQDHNAGLDYVVTQTGPHRILATSYRAGESGAYTLVVTGAGAAGTTPAPATGGTGNTTPTGPTFRTVRGTLAQGDQTLQAGEFYDEEVLTLPAGATVNLQMRSTAFDTYILVRSPSGHQEENDDAVQGSTDSALTLQAREAGEYHIRATSYRAGMVGPYELVIGAPSGASAPTPGTVTPPPTTQPTPVAGVQPIRGSLARGDQTLASGEFVDTHSVTLPQGSPVRLRLASSAFDPYLIVRTPSGRQLDNDDLVPGATNAGIDLPVAESGTYTVQVTSYRAAETGAYTLTFERGASIPGGGPVAQPNVPPGTNPPQQGGRVFGVFAGITDYPSGINDLPECANDARKMSETLTQGGLIDPATHIVLTDAQATVGAVRGAIQRFAQQMGPDDVFVFFYSGHGNRRAGSRDTREIDSQDETIVLYDGEILDDEMGTLFDSIRARTSILALDSCFAGGFAKDVITRPGRVGLFSSEEDVTSGVAQQFQAGGYLSYFIRTAMQGAADNDPQDRVLTVGELTHYLHTQFGQHVTDVRMGSAYQQLVVDRGAVSSETVLWAYRR